jgi:adenine-specific DNA-methyltransferase
MSKFKPKLELTWIGKENSPKLEPRILMEEPEKSYHAKETQTSSTTSSSSETTSLR